MIPAAVSACDVSSLGHVAEAGRGVSRPTNHQADPEHPGCFLFNGEWEPWRERTETIAVRQAAPITKTIRFSRNGPIVDEVLPPPADKTGPISLKWLGTYEGGWLTALLGMDRVRKLLEWESGQ